MTLDHDRAIAILETYGAAPHRWPEAEREAMTALMAAPDEALKIALYEAQSLDLWLANDPVDETDFKAVTRFSPWVMAPKQRVLTFSAGLTAVVLGMVIGVGWAEQRVSDISQMAVLEEAQLLPTENNG